MPRAVWVDDDIRTDSIKVHGGVGRIWGHRDWTVTIGVVARRVVKLRLLRDCATVHQGPASS
jgi:hypothetical protein